MSLIQSAQILLFGRGRTAVPVPPPSPPGFTPSVDMEDAGDVLPLESELSRLLLERELPQSPSIARLYEVESEPRPLADYALAIEYLDAKGGLSRRRIELRAAEEKGGVLLRPHDRRSRRHPVGRHVMSTIAEGRDCARTRRPSAGDACLGRAGKGDPPAASFPLGTMPMLARACRAGRPSVGCSRSGGLPAPGRVRRGSGSSR